MIYHLGVIDSTPVAWALPKLNECFVIVSVIIFFTLLSGGSLGSIYIQKGNLKLGLTTDAIWHNRCLFKAANNTSLQPTCSARLR
jgi:hypothetical protein